MNPYNKPQMQALHAQKLHAELLAWDSDVVADGHEQPTASALSCSESPGFWFPPTLRVYKFRV